MSAEAALKFFCVQVFLFVRSQSCLSVLVTKNCDLNQLYLIAIDKPSDLVVAVFEGIGIICSYSIESSLAKEFSLRITKLSFKNTWNNKQLF